MTATTDTIARTTTAKHLGGYYKALIEEGIPEPLATDIVRMHGSDCRCLSDDGTPYVVVAA